MELKLIDSHAHLYVNEFDSDLPLVLDRARQVGISRIFLPAIDSHSHEAMARLEKNSAGFCRSMMGLHPCSVRENYQSELDKVAENLARGGYVAVGEIGMDLYWSKSFLVNQKHVFNYQTELALHYNLPIVIHSRNATEECLAIVRNHQKGRLKGVFHCFSGNLVQAKEAIELGFYLGIGGVITYKNSGGLDHIVKETDLRHILLETDSPYLSPVPFRGKRNESSYLKFIAQKIAELKETRLEDVAGITTMNAEELFGL